MTNASELNDARSSLQEIRDTEKKLKKRADDDLQKRLVFFGLILDNEAGKLETFLHTAPEAVKWMDGGYRPPLVVARMLDVTEVLLKYSADPNQATRNHGITAISAHLLTRHQQNLQTAEDLIIEKLMDHGGRIDLAVQIDKKTTGPTAVELAHRYDDRSALSIFSKRDPVGLAAATKAYVAKLEEQQAVSPFRKSFRSGSVFDAPGAKNPAINVIKAVTAKLFNRPL